MDFIIGMLLGSRLFTFLTGGLGPGELQAYFSPPSIVVVRQNVLVSCALINGYPKRLRDLAQAATPVLLYVTVELRDETESTPVVNRTEESILTFDLVGKTYTVSHSRGAEPMRYSALDSALAGAALFREVPVAPIAEIAADHWYHLVIYAVLGKARIEALGNKEVDLMYYWDYKRPMVKTERFKGEELLKLAHRQTAAP
jgi:hypothetical protein